MTSRRFSNLLLPTDPSTPANRKKDLLELSASMAETQSEGSHQSSDEDKLDIKKENEDGFGSIFSRVGPKSSGVKTADINNNNNINIHSGNINKNKNDPTNSTQLLLRLRRLMIIISLNLIIYFMHLVQWVRILCAYFLR